MGSVHRRRPDGSWDGGERHEFGPGDVVYVGGDELHCFEALGDEPLGFICVVPPS
jgi:mannose-6-phosphate isomerase-like protein (cupin superfamily)